MTKKERHEAWVAQDLKAAICVNCEYFCAHYVKEEETEMFIETMYGHCIVANRKIRLQHDGCDRFENRKR